MSHGGEFKSKMFVIKRNGNKQDVHFDKITARIGKLAYGLNPDFCDPVRAPCKLLTAFCVAVNGLARFKNVQ